MTTLRNVWKERVKRPGKRWLSLSASPGPLPTCTKRGNVDLSKGALIQETTSGRNIQLVDGIALKQWVTQHKAQQTGPVAEPAAITQPLPPSCPNCNAT